jgi:multidrug efflux pump subunit AcrB
VNVTDWSIRHRVAVWVLMVLIAVAGIGAWTSLPRESFPEVEIPLILVYTPFK